MIKVALGLALLLSVAGPIAAVAEDETRPDPGRSSWSLGVAVGNFDSDTSESDDPHLNEAAFSLLASFQPWRFLALDAELLHIETARELDEFNELTAFGATGVSLTARLQIPLPEDISIYLRAGSSWLKLDDESQVRDSPMATDRTQPTFGGGISGRYWFVEYVNYGQADDLYLEQLRAGMIWRF
ncbi:MAG: hypothetical protein AAGG11_05475 [Pseudomonadota bacterium]